MMFLHLGLRYKKSAPALTKTVCGVASTSTDSAFLKWTGTIEVVWKKATGMDNVRNVERAPEIATLNQNASLDDQLKEESWNCWSNIDVQFISMYHTYSYFLVHMADLWLKSLDCAYTLCFSRKNTLKHKPLMNQKNSYYPEPSPTLASNSNNCFTVWRLAWTLFRSFVSRSAEFAASERRSTALLTLAIFATKYSRESKGKVFSV